LKKINQKWITRFSPVAFCLVIVFRGHAQAPPPLLPVEQPDAQRTRGEFSQLLQRYPPELRGVLGLDPSLLGNQSYLAPYSALVNFLSAHPEIARNPGFYVGEPFIRGRDRDSQVVDAWRDDIQGLEFLTAFAVALCLIGWLIKTLMDYRRWNRQNKVQTEVHTKVLDRLTGNEELLAYLQSPAGSKFLESSPIMLDSPHRSAGAPVGRILWTLQAGVVLIAAGGGLVVVSSRTRNDAAGPLHALGILSIALGIGFVISAIISFVISRRLGLIQMPRAEG
jgi:uncharacterized protein (DUF433 family)